MFYINSSCNFKGLKLNHYGKLIIDDSLREVYGVIYSEDSKYFNINLKRVDIKSLYFYGIIINRMIGNIDNCNIQTKMIGVAVGNGKVNITDSIIKSSSTSGIYIGTWKGNIKNSIITVNKDVGVSSDKWDGKIIKSKIYSNLHSGAFLGVSKGIIQDCVIKSKNSYGLEVTKDVKIIHSYISSKKGLKKIHIFKPILSISTVDVITKDYNEKPLSQGYYRITVRNDGCESSNYCYLSFKTMKISKKYYVKPLKSGQETTIKIKFNSKYMTEKMDIKYPKKFTVDCYKQIKQETRSNNEYRIDKKYWVDIRFEPIPDE